MACKASIPSSNLGATFNFKSPVLYLIATPIGNLADFSPRAIEILQASDYILCEDTRHSRILLDHWGIKKDLKSHHQFNESRTLEPLLQDLQEGKVISLLSDAGTPGIADPGARLVKACRDLGLPVSSAPGPCAAIVALSVSGFDSQRFQFLGFLPKTDALKRKMLQEALHYPGTSIFYESPNRLLDSLMLLKELDSKRKVAVARELTKHFEEFELGTAEQLLERWHAKTVRGEIVLLIEGQTEPSIDWSSLSVQDHIALMQQDYGLSHMEAIKAVAQLRGIPKRVIYNESHNQKN